MIEVKGLNLDLVPADRKPGEKWRDPDGLPKQRVVAPVPEFITVALEEWLAAGKSFKSFCEQPGMPTTSVIQRWRQGRPEFNERVQRARAIGLDTIAEQALEIADTPQIGETVIREPDANKGRGRTRRITEDMVVHRRLQVETRLRLLAVWDPKKFGPKAQIEHQGSIGLADQLQQAQQRLMDSRGEAPVLPDATAQALTGAVAEASAGSVLQLPSIPELPPGLK